MTLVRSREGMESTMPPTQVINNNTPTRLGEKDHVNSSYRNEATTATIGRWGCSMQTAAMTSFGP
jgi:hypothetical protein